jgi:hypothetical protein
VKFIMLKVSERAKGLERHCQIRLILISSTTMSIHLAGWAINRDGARAVKKLRFLNISLVWIRSLKKRWDLVHASYENTEGDGSEPGISKNDDES